MDGAALVRRYYDALDAHDYDALRAVLDPAFVQRRPDRTFEGRTAFVRFVREERPNSETAHDLDAIVADGARVAARGRVREIHADEHLFEFADFFRIDDGRICRLETYSR